MAIDHRSRRRKPKSQLAAMKNISMPQVVARALDGLAGRAGHGNSSRIIQELVTREAIYQFGPDWAERFAESESEPQTEAA